MATVGVKGLNAMALGTQRSWGTHPAMPLFYWVAALDNGQVSHCLPSLLSSKKLEYKTKESVRTGPLLRLN